MSVNHAKVLQLNIAGQPMCWITCERAATMTVNGQVAWSASEDQFVLTGGINRATGKLSTVAVNSIIAIRGEINKHNSQGKILLTNRALFARDEYTCAYCGEVFKRYKELSRDHVIPISRGGEDDWNNVVTSCIPCNQKKSNKNLKHSGMRLLYVPYKPCHSESLILSNRRILADQQKFLMQSIKKYKTQH